jgi:parallel beta-helix repeat protein
MRTVFACVVAIILALLLVDTTPVHAACVAPPSGLVSWWGGDNNALDIVGVNNAAPHGGVTYGAGEVGSAFNLDGADGSYLQVPYSSSLDIQGSLSISAWVYIRDTSGTRLIAGKAGSTQLYSQAGSLHFVIYDSPTNPQHVVSAATLSANTWYHVAAVFDSGTGQSRIYLNGALDNSAPITGLPVADPDPYEIGGFSGYGSNLDGHIDELAIFNKALSDSEIAAIYNSGSDGICKSAFPPTSGLVSWWRGEGNTSDSVGGNNGTLEGGATFAPGKFGQAFFFDGASFIQVLTPQNIPVGNNPRTISAWVNSAGGTNLYQGIVGYGTPTNPGQVLFFEWGGNAEDLNRLYTMNLSWGARGATLLAYDTWYHVALTHDGSNTRLYVNGRLDANEAMTQNTVMNDAGLRIGLSPDFDGWHGYFKGLIDEVKIYDRVLSDSEVSRLAGTYPDAFSFTPATGRPLSTWIESSAITVTGTANSAPISITGGQYAISTTNGSSWGEWTTVPGTVNLNDQVKVRLTSAATNTTPTTATLNIGGVSGNFTVTTLVSTAVSGTITVNSTWTAVNSPYVVVGDLGINPGVTLTIEAGTVVKFNGTNLSVSGTLNAAGTSGSPVYFTSYHDDSVGGDSNGNGGATTPAPGNWVSILVNDGGSANLSYSTIRYAGAYLGGSAVATGMGGIFKTGSGSLGVDHCTITDTSTKGIWMSAATGAISVTNSTISNNPVNGVLLEGSSATVTLSGNTIQNNTGSGIFSNNCSPSISANTISGNSTYGIYVTGLAVPGSITGNTLSSNTSGSMGIDANSSGVTVADNNIFTGGLSITGGTIDRDITWNNNRTYAIMADVAINPGKTLTIPAGRVVKLNGAYFYVSGTLNAPGSGASPIYFTSYHDDTVGGDSNGNGGATTPAPGNWVSIVVNDGGSATLSHCTIRYAGGYMGGSAQYYGMGSIFKTGSGNLSVDHCNIADNVTKGFWLTGATGTISITNSTISNNSVGNNSAYGIHADNSSATMTISGNTIQNNNSGIYVINSSPAIYGNTISGNGWYGIYVTGLSVPSTVTNNSISGNTNGSIGIDANSSGLTVADDNTFTDGLSITGGTINRDISWNNNRTYAVIADIAINAGKTLAIPAGRVVKFNGTYLYVDGTLNATGTAESPVYFTSYHDDSVGGDTNGNGSATTPAPGNWITIAVNNGGSAALSHCIIRYAGAYMNGSAIWSGMGSIYKTGFGALSVDHCSITDNGTKGIWLSGASDTISATNSTISNNSVNGLLIENSPAAMTISGNIIQNNTNSGIAITNSSPVISANTISSNSSIGIYVNGTTSLPVISSNRINSNPYGIYVSNSANPVIGGSEVNGNDIYSNTSFGVYNDSAVTVNAQYNWWGSKTGPTHVSNTGGEGDKVSDYVDFSNFLTYWATYIYTLTLDLTNTGTGHITAPALSLTCNSDCTGQAHKGQSLTLHAEPAVDSVFDGWTGGGCSGDGDCIFTMDNDTTVQAAFRGVPPTADFSGTPLSGVEPLIVSFTDLSGYGPYSWLWNFGDSSGSSAKNPTHAYLDPGNFTVGLTATNAYGSETETKNNYVTVTACSHGPASILPDFYTTLQEAYNHSPNGSEIRARYKILGEALNINRENTTVYIYGGYDCNHQNQLGYTYVTGLQITGGTVVLRDIVIK